MPMLMPVRQISDYQTNKNSENYETVRFRTVGDTKTDRLGLTDTLLLNLSPSNFNMLGYYLNSGDEEGANMFTPYVWGKCGLDTLIKSKLSNGYGKDLKLLLIQYYVEGRFSSYLPNQPKLGNYMKKSMDIAVAVGVTKENFHDRNEFERREFILDSTINAISLVRSRLHKKNLEINFDKFLQDLQQIGNEYLIHPEPYR